MRRTVEWRRASVFMAATLRSPRRGICRRRTALAGPPRGGLGRDRLRPESDAATGAPSYPRGVELPGLVRRSRRRWVADGLPDYPMWIAALIDSAALVTAVVVVAQRHADGLLPAVGLVAVALLPWCLELWLRGETWVAFVVLTGGPVLVLMTVHPVAYEWAPFLLILMAGH